MTLADFLRNWERIALAAVNSGAIDDDKFASIAKRFGNIDYYRKCADGQWRQADDCVYCADGEYRKEDECTEIDGRYYLSDECGYCDNCESHLPPGEDTVRCGREDWCDYCYNNYARECECGCRVSHCDDDNWVNCVDTEEWYWLPSHDDLYYRDGEYYRNCPDEDEIPDDVPGYHAKRNSRARDEWNDNADNAEVYGIELETYCDNALEVCQEIYERGWIAERDGSLDSDCGLEIIAPPMALAQIKKHWQDVLKLPTRAWEAGTCYGMHVSVNRASFFDNTAWQRNFVLFIHENKTFCELIAGRRENQWAHYSIPPQQGSKYEACNICERRIEVRIFRATLKLSSFMKNVEFVCAAQRFTRECTDADCKATLPNFLDYVQRNADTFPNLHSFLETKNLYAKFAPKKEAAQCV